MKIKIVKKVAVLACISLFIINLGVMANNNKLPKASEDDTEGPPYSGYKLNFDKACCQESYNPNDECSDAWGLC